MTGESALVAPHYDAIPESHRFPQVRFRGVEWDLSHLEPFAFKQEIDPSTTVDVVVLFSCHCFTHSADDDDRDFIPAAEHYQDGRERRVLNDERYWLSKRHLPGLVEALATRHIRIVSDRPNFMTIETAGSDSRVSYALFFELTRDNARRKRLILRVQSAYPMVGLTRRLKEARKINFHVLAAAVYAGRKIRP
jgi:hypothetical protein